MQKLRSTTYWGIIAGGAGFAEFCAATTAVQTDGQGRAGQDWWSLQPPRPVAVPRAEDTQWLINPIDQFILQRLRKEGLSPSLRADRRTRKSPSSGASPRSTG